MQAFIHFSHEQSQSSTIFLWPTWSDPRVQRVQFLERVWSSESSMSFKIQWIERQHLSKSLPRLFADIGRALKAALTA